MFGIFFEKKHKKTIMKGFKVSVILLIMMLFTSLVAHKYYVSITEIEFVKEKKSVQIITRIFIDDFQRLLQERYDDTLELDNGQDEEKIDQYIEKYLTSKFKIEINNKEKALNYIGKEYDNDIVYCYFEIEKISKIKTFKIENTTLFDLFSEQKKCSSYKHLQ